MMPVYSGSEESKEAIASYEKAELLMLQLGMAQKMIPLNGGSDTRKASREYWHEWARAAGVKCESNGGMVVLGGNVGGE